MSNREHPPELLEQRPFAAEEPYVDPDAVKLGPPPRKYTKAVHDTIVAELKKGQRPQGACARAGITVNTFYDWVKRGKEGDPWLYKFAEDVEIAFNSHEADMVDVLVEATEDKEDRKTAVDAAKWKLERTRSDGYSKQVKTLVEKQIEQFMVRLEKALDPATFEKVLSVYLGQVVSTELGTKEAALLPEHGESEESGDSAEE